MIDGKERMIGGEGRLVRRALHRWALPHDVGEFSGGDAPAGAMIMQGKIASALKLSNYVDFDGKYSDGSRCRRATQASSA
ncbi:hypothetical protein [Enhygromyxa salina]|uniref:Uncharacterized protein n=1 Tax=Enhygromyxa salina TaxID=215803 RepID=A0A2S9YT69_9BACT|nr:hypothetical protein [Enhygromyxa salina]PRQ08293.1 hypothetical protein ENSA7_19160 [Enhygromyxa salina]